MTDASIEQTALEQRATDPRLEIAATTETPQTPAVTETCLLYTSPSPRDRQKSRMPSSA